MEHVSKFIHSMGPYAGDKELCLREFAKSLVDITYTWYTTLRPGSIKTLNEMMERLCAKYCPSEEELNHVLNKWIGDDIVRTFTVSRPPTE